MYIVMKEGTALREMKTLGSAKKLADAEGGTVYRDGECVYQAPTPNRAEMPPAAEQTKKPVRYRLKAVMNVRSAPSVETEIIAILPAGTIVDVLRIENDWLCLTDGRFILYGDGCWAERSEK